MKKSGSHNGDDRDFGYGCFFQDFRGHLSTWRPCSELTLLETRCFPRIHGANPWVESRCACLNPALALPNTAQAPTTNTCSLPCSDRVGMQLIAARRPLRRQGKEQSLWALKRPGAGIGSAKEREGSYTAGRSFIARAKKRARNGIRRGGHQVIAVCTHGRGQ